MSNYFFSANCTMAITQTRRRMMKRRLKRRAPRRKILYRRYRSSRGTKYFTIRRDSIRDSTNQCHFLITGTATGATANLSSTFQMNDMAGSGELKSLFDNYKINSIAFRWVLVRDEDYTSVNAGSYVRIVQVRDYNDQIVPASSSQLRQYANSQEIVFKGSQSMTKWFYMKPASLQLFYVTSVTSATGPVWGKYLDTSQDTVPHYGIKYAIENLYTGATLRLEVKVNATFKGVS